MAMLGIIANTHCNYLDTCRKADA